MSEYVVGGVDPDEQVSCLYCGYDRVYPEPTYYRGEAVLAGPDHPPYDGNANYICLPHLNFPEGASVVVVDWGVPRGQVITLAEYAELREAHSVPEQG